MTQRALSTSLLVTLLGCPATTPPAATAHDAPTEVEIDGLVWLAGPAPSLTWSEAQAWCAERGMALMEQNNLMLALMKHPALNDPPGTYWSSGASAIDESAYVSFARDGAVGATLAPRGERHLVRCVRVVTRVE